MNIIKSFIVIGILAISTNIYAIPERDVYAISTHDESYLTREAFCIRRMHHANNIIMFEYMLTMDESIAIYRKRAGEIGLSEPLIERFVQIINDIYNEDIETSGGIYLKYMYRDCLINKGL